MSGCSNLLEITYLVNQPSPTYIQPQYACRIKNKQHKRRAKQWSDRNITNSNSQQQKQSKDHHQELTAEESVLHENKSAPFHHAGCEKFPIGKQLVWANLPVGFLFQIDFDLTAISPVPCSQTSYRGLAKLGLNRRRNELKNLRADFVWQSSYWLNTRYP